MLKDYFNLIRTALQESRQKGDVYYEAHHIVPQSFKKKSATVLLTPEEHYECHRLLAEAFKYHSVYGQKMLWAFHRLAYDKKRKLTAEQYGEVRRMLMPLWKKSKSEDFKQKASERMKGVNNPNHKGKHNLGRVCTEETRQKIGSKTRERQIGKTGLQARASKGIVIYENSVSGKNLEAGSALQLASLVGESQSTIAFRLKYHHGKEIKGWKVYYKNGI